jgi:hypothetical protein
LDRLPILILAATFLAGCSDARSEAAGELLRLDQAIQAHAARYGDFPRRLDAASPASATNLPFAGRKGVEVRLNGVSGGRYAATARRGVWLCWAGAGRNEPVRPDCAPTGAAPDSAEAPPLPLTPR